MGGVIFFFFFFFPFDLITVLASVSAHGDIIRRGELIIFLALRLPILLTLGSNSCAIFDIPFSLSPFSPRFSFIAEHQFHFVPTKRRVRARSEEGRKRMDRVFRSERKREREKGQRSRKRWRERKRIRGDLIPDRIERKG